MPRVMKKVFKLLYPQHLAVYKDLKNFIVEAEEIRFINQVTTTSPTSPTAIDQRDHQQRGLYSEASALNNNSTQNNHVRPTAPPLQIEVVTDGSIYNVD